MSRDLTGRVSVVTGGCGGIGLGVAYELASLGSAVVLLDLLKTAPATRAIELADGAGVEAMGLSGSVTNPGDVSLAVEAVTQRFGRLDILINTAGVAGRRGHVVGLDDESWDLVLKTHLYGTMHTTRAVLPAMLEAGWGRIVNITSSAAWRPGPGIAAYAAAKAGITGFTRAVAAEVGALGVTVNCVAPGLTATSHVMAVWPDPDVLAEQVKRVGPAVPRMAQVAEIAVATAGLCLPSAGYTTGSTVHVNGGSFMP